MRVLVFFDLLVITREQRREYKRFRKSLLKNGFMWALKQSGGTQVTFKVEGNRDNIFKVTKEEASAYYQRTGTPAYEF